jgi:hypothetical protein
MKCAAFSFFPWKGASTWPAGWLPASQEQLGPESKRALAPARWSHFSPGKQGVYAIREHQPWLKEPFSVDLLRPDGSIETFFQDDDGRFSDVEIVETSKGPLGIFRRIPEAAQDRPYQSVGALVAAPLLVADGKAQVRNTKKLPIGDLWMDARASDVRDARKLHRHAGYGPFRGVALQDAQGNPTEQVVLVWFEAIPPPGHEEKQEAPRKSKKAKDQCGRLDTSAFEERRFRRYPMSGDGCGGRMSRKVSSPDVKKRLHLTRLDASGALQDDRIIDLPANHDAEGQPLTVVARPGGGLVVNEMSFNARLRRGPDLTPEQRSAATLSPPALQGPAPRHLVAAAFDPTSAEALFLYREAVFQKNPEDSGWDKLFALRVSHKGEALEEPLELPLARHRWDVPLLARVEGGWVAVIPDVYTTAPGHPTEKLHLLGIGPSHRGKILEIPCPDGSCDGTEVEQVLTEHPEHPELLLTIRKADVPPSSLLLPFDPRSWTFGESKTNPRGEAGSEPRKQVENFHVWNNEVRLNKLTATWVRSGTSIELTPGQLFSPPPENFQRMSNAPRGPVLDGYDKVWPATPGEPIKLPTELREVLKSCPVQIPTGPRAMLLGCTEATDPQLPVVQIGTRVVRYLSSPRGAPPRSSHRGTGCC